MIIGLTGYKQSGKNTVAKKIAYWSHPTKVVELAFATKLKESFAALFDCSIDDLETWKNDPNMVVAIGLQVGELGIVQPIMQTVRSALQRYGTEAHRGVFGYDFWSNAELPFPAGAPLTDTAGLRAFNARHYDDALYVVTDVRFENEANRVLDLGGTLVRVIGPAEIEREDGHASETQLPDNFIDHTILNTKRDDNYAALDLEVRKLLRNLTKE